MKDKSSLFDIVQLITEDGHFRFLDSGQVITRSLIFKMWW